MKAKFIITKMLDLYINNNEATTVTTGTNPLEDFRNAIGYFIASSKLLPNTCYFLVWENIEDSPRIEDPDAIIIPNDCGTKHYICLYVIE